VGIGIDRHYHPLYDDQLSTNSSITKAATNCYIAAAIYAVFVIICVLRLFFLKRAEIRAAEVMKPEEL